MNLIEHLLTCLAEEGAEVTQACTKSIRFGLDDKYPERGTTNLEDIEREFNELIGVVQLLNEQGVRIGLKPEIQEAKKHKVRKWMAYARERGTLDTVAVALQQCDHKFIDSNRCLKCGWEYDRTNPAHNPTLLRK